MNEDQRFALLQQDLGWERLIDSRNRIIVKGTYGTPAEFKAALEPLISELRRLIAADVQAMEDIISMPQEPYQTA